MTAEPMAAAPAPDYPVRFDVEYPDELSRLLIFFKWLLAFPAMVILLIVSLVVYLPFAAFFTILVRGKYPKWWFDVVVQFAALQERFYAYALLLRDEYPALEDAPSVRLDVDYPATFSRWAPLYKWLLAIPHFLVAYVLTLLAYVFTIIAWFAILFTGRYPKGLFDFVVGSRRYALRVSAYALYLLTDEYPPFSMK